MPSSPMRSHAGKLRASSIVLVSNAAVLPPVKRRSPVMPLECQSRIFFVASGSSRLTEPTPVTRPLYFGSESVT